MKIIFAGSPEPAAPTLRALLQSDLEVAGVITRPPARRGRRGAKQPTPIADIAREQNLPLIETDRPNDTEIAQQIAAWDADLGVVVAYGAILKPQLLEVPTHGWINLHFSALPRWRGAAPVQWAIRQGDTATATSVFQLEADLDTGPVYSMLNWRLDGTETAGQLLENLSEQGAAQVIDVAAQIRAGSAQAHVQSQEGVTLAPRLSKADAFIDFNASAEQVDRNIRSVTPNPGAWTALAGGKTLRLGPVGPAEDFASSPGMVKATKNAVYVQCGSGAVQLGEVAPAGRNWMPAAAWARGAHLTSETKLGGSLD